MKLFQQRHPRTSEIYEITHKAARLLKRRLERDASWEAFCQRVGRARAQVRQTELACLVPPSIGTKARFMNLGSLIRWGEETLQLLERPPARLPAHLTVERLQEKFGWLRDFQAP